MRSDEAFYIEVIQKKTVNAKIGGNYWYIHNDRRMCDMQAHYVFL